MYDVQGVEIPGPLADLPDHRGNHPLIKKEHPLLLCLPLFLHLLVQTTLRCELSDQVKIGLITKVPIELDDVGVLAERLDLNLPD